MFSKCYNNSAEIYFFSEFAEQFAEHKSQNPSKYNR